MSDPTERKSPVPTAPPAPPSAGSEVTHEKGAVNVSSESAHSTSDGDGIVLVPRPSDDPRDPLNWTLKRKLTVGFTLWFALLMSYSAPFNGQVQIAQQAALYHKTTVEITYFVSGPTNHLPSTLSNLSRFPELSSIWWSRSRLLGMVGSIQEDRPWCCRLLDHALRPRNTALGVLYAQS
jgi:hypothetical protein